MDAVPGAPGTAPDFHLKSSQSSGYVARVADLFALGFLGMQLLDAVGRMFVCAHADRAGVGRLRVGDEASLKKRRSTGRRQREPTGFSHTEGVHGRADWARESPAQVVMVSILAWTFLYFASRALLPFSATYGKWDRERQYKARGLVPSSVFLLGIVPFSIWALTSDADLRGVRVTGATSSSLLISAIATGYFIYDTLVVLYHFKDDGVAYLVHGLLCMVCALCFLFSAWCAPFVFSCSCCIVRCMCRLVSSTLHCAARAALK